jgi:hypothetical protein
MTKFPQKGFYYHYKHDPRGSIYDYAYEVLGIGLHTEGNHSEMSPKDLFVVYRPIYEAYVYKMGKMFDIRPLDMFMGEVEKDGKVLKRFTQITDPNIISELKKKKDEMYKE